MDNNTEQDTRQWSYSVFTATGHCMLASRIPFKNQHNMPCSWHLSNSDARSRKQGWEVVGRWVDVHSEGEKKRHFLQLSVQDDEACQVQQQMRDIPETLQDKMGQKMRLTVNGLLSGPLPDFYLQNFYFILFFSPQSNLSVYVPSQFWRKLTRDWFSS